MRPRGCFLKQYKNHNFIAKSFNMMVALIEHILKIKKYMCAMIETARSPLLHSQPPDLA